MDYLKIRKHEHPKHLEEAWRRLYASNSALSPYQDFDFMQIAYVYSRFSPRRFDLKPIFYEISDAAGETLLIAPLYIRRGMRQKTIYLFGDFVATSYLDMIYGPDLSLENFKGAMKKISEDLRWPVFCFNKINERSRLNDFIRTAYGDSLHIHPKPCVEIPFSEDYDAYFQGLRPSTRHSVRKAHRRIERAGLELRIEISQDGPVDKELLDKMMNLYNKRAAERIKNPLLSVPLGIAKKKINPMTLALGSLKHAFGSILYLDDKMAAICAGFHRRERIVLFYLGIDSDFGFYSPGGLLITETLKKLSSQGRFDVFDLTRGDEPYKFVYGGKATVNDDFIFKVSCL